MNESLYNKILQETNILLILPQQFYNKSFHEALLNKVNDVLVAYTVKEAVQYYNSEKVDIIISDVVFENEDIIKFCQSLRKINKLLPIILLGNVTETKLLLEFIKLNLVEYILKPININIFKNALLKSAEQIYDNGTYEVCFENVIYNVRKKSLTNIMSNKDIPLTANEIKLLDLLIFNKKIVLSKESIMDSVWEFSYEITDEAFKSLLNRLRQKIGKQHIKNIPGSGYLLNT